MKEGNTTDFSSAQRLAALLSREYAEDLFRLLVVYKDISASEAASRLDLHIKTVQDFLESLEQAGMVKKRVSAEKKRPYFRYSLRNSKLCLTIDLDSLYDRSAHHSWRNRHIRERRDSGALFKEGRDHIISAVHLYEGKGRARIERRLSLTECQGRFLFHIPFPTENALSVEEIGQKAGISEECTPEVIDLIDILQRHGVIVVEEKKN